MPLSWGTAAALVGLPALLAFPSMDCTAGGSPHSAAGHRPEGSTARGRCASTR
ncbi:hypothetical protein L083_0693 [Actinoplanes sp. N902-109]|nr:hypothetical protein L083_0693 [Actinoplanes sp. N902-109]